MAARSKQVGQPFVEPSLERTPGMEDGTGSA
jgi:hypothetical protein